MNRRKFLKQLAGLTVASAVAGKLLPVTPSEIKRDILFFHEPMVRASEVNRLMLNDSVSRVVIRHSHLIIDKGFVVPKGKSLFMEYCTGEIAAECGYLAVDGEGRGVIRFCDFYVSWEHSFSIGLFDSL